MFKVVFALHGEKRGGVDACTHRSHIPLDQGISVIQEMPLPGQAIGLEASLITFFSGSGNLAGDPKTCSNNFCIWSLHSRT